MLGFSISCTDENEPGGNDVVVEAFLYAGEPVTDIRLKRIVKFNSGEETLYINDADVTIGYLGQAFALVPSPGDSGFYHYPGLDLEIIPGQTYTLEVNTVGTFITSETVVPQSPTGLALSNNLIEVPKINSIFDLEVFGEIPEINVTWNNTEGVYHFLLTANTLENPEPLNESGFDLAGRLSQILVSAPTLNDFDVIRPALLTTYGLHSVKLFRINQEYVDLFSSFQQDSRNLNEPLTNIEGGVGIFTAFSSQEVFFEVRKP